jgi:UDP-2-acetamido-3-amino-2,3-dideoxy-glucuronate N-acetyltransferase
MEQLGKELGNMSNYYKHDSSIVSVSAVIETGVKIWHFCHVMDNTFIGENTVIGQNVFVGRNVKIGKKCKIQNNVSLFDGVICDNEVFIGPSVVFTNVINPRSFIERKDEFKLTKVEQGASIGANATIICGNKIGRFSFIGAGSVVNRDIKDFELVVGNPIRNIGWISKEGVKLNFEKTNRISLEGVTYILKNNKVKIEE